MEAVRNRSKFSEGTRSARGRRDITESDNLHYFLMAGCVLSLPFSFLFFFPISMNNKIFIIVERRATAIFQSCDSCEKEKSANETFCAIERCNAVPDSPIRFREYILTLDILFLHQYLIVANKMAVVCTPPRWAIKARGGPVIVNSRSRYILVCCHSCVRVCLRVACNACIPEREMEGEKEREGKLTKRESDGEKTERERSEKKRRF